MNKLVTLAIATIVIASLVYAFVYEANLPKIASGSTGEIFKVNNVNYANNDSVQVYFISWYGCPNGATASWELYLALSKFGYVSVEPHGSKFNPDIGSSVPGLIFTGFTPSSNVYFHYLYVYNEYLNETTTGIPIPNLASNQAVYLGLNIVKQDEPGWVYNLVYYYMIEDNLVNIGNGSIALGYHHLVTMCVITGPKGTYAFILYPNPITPVLLLKSLGLSSLSTGQAEGYAKVLLANITQGQEIPSVIVQAENNLLDVINQELS